MNTVQLSEFLDTELLSKLESVSGVASVSTSGNVSEQVNLMLSQEKIDALYSKIYAEVDKNFAEPLKGIEEGEAALKPAYDAFMDSIAQIDANEQLTAEMKEASKTQITNSAQYKQVMTAWDELQAGRQELEAAMEEAHAQINLDKLLSMDTLSGILTAQDFSMPAGYVVQ
jgi:HAE1 family hydrophobic/amphiphilic exporter-1